MASSEESQSQYKNLVVICSTDANEKHSNLTDESNLSSEHCQISKECSLVKAGVQQPSINPGDLDLESGSPYVKKIVDNSDKHCRICFNNYEAYSQEFGVPIALGCSCNGDLAFVHKKCAEKWFEIKGNKNCEICGSMVKNFVGSGDTDFTECTIQSSNDVAAAYEAQRFCYGNRLIKYSILGVTLLIIIFYCLEQNFF